MRLNEKLKRPTMNIVKFMAVQVEDGAINAPFIH